MLKHFWFLILLFCNIFVVTGCGGGGGGGSTTPSTLSFAVNWPERSRDITAPSSALSLVLTVTGGTDAGDLVFQANRGANLSAHRETYSTSQRPKRGTFPYSVRFYSEANGGGTVVATASGQVAVQGASVLPDVTLQGKVTSVVISEGQHLDLGETRSLTVEARDAQGDLVAVTPGSFRWTVVSGGQYLTLNQGEFTGAAAGTATVRVSVDGVTSADTSVVVSGTTLVTYKVGPDLVWAAFQDGDGPWQPVTNLPADGVLRASVTDAAGRYGWMVETKVVRTDLSKTFYYTNIRHMTVSEAVDLNGIAPPTASGSFPLRDIKVNFVHGAGEVMYSVRFSNVISSKGKDFIIDRAYTGPLLAYAYTVVNGTPRRMVLLRDVAETTNEITFDFTGPESFKLEKQVFPESVRDSTLYFKGAHSGIRTFDPPQVLEGGGKTIYQIPNSLLRPGEFYEAIARQDTTTFNWLTAFYSLTPYPGADFRPLDDWNPAVAKTEDGSSVRVSLPFSAQATSYGSLSLTDSGSFNLSMSKGWHGEGDLVYTVPTFTAEQGWLPAFTKPKGQVRVSIAQRSYTAQQSEDISSEPYPARESILATWGSSIRTYSYTLTLP